MSDERSAVITKVVSDGNGGQKIVDSALELFRNFLTAVPVITKVVSDGNGGQKIVDSALELFRKWSGPALMAVGLWIAKLALAELVALHDGQLKLVAGQDRMATEIKAVAAQSSENAARISGVDVRLADRIQGHDKWALEERDKMLKRISDLEKKK